MNKTYDTTSLLHDSRVAVSFGHHGYRAAPPFDPGSGLPEYPWKTATSGPNPGYDGVRRCLHLLAYDAARFETPRWNPLSELIRPGQTVVIKPNLVRHFRETQPGHADCLITHGSIIRAIVDYVFLALDGRGRIVIADAPHNDADFDKVQAITGLTEIQEFYRRHAGFEIEIYDLRPEQARKIQGVIVGHELLPGDPAGYAKVDLGPHSSFRTVEHLGNLLYGAEYCTSELHEHHRGGKHEYLISATVLSADVVIGLPKLKTHKKVGLTAALKNLVGINGNKNWLPHHREGCPRQGGDQFPTNGTSRRAERWATATFKRCFPLLGPLRGLAAGPAMGLGRRIFGHTETGAIRSGNWYGNDTAWRMVLDLNRAFLYADRTGRLHKTPQRQYLNFTDAIVAGQKSGPLNPAPYAAGVVLAARNPLAMDMACARLMGFDYRLIPLLREGFGEHDLPLAEYAPDDLQVRAEVGAPDVPLAEVEALDPAFEPHFGWQGHIELAAAPRNRLAGAAAG